MAGGGLCQNGEVNWYFLGILTNERPSSIYKVGKLTKCSQLDNGVHPFGNQYNLQTINGVVQAQLGIMVDRISNLPQVVDVDPNATNIDALTKFTHFAAESLFNYVASFIHDSSGGDALVPISAIKRWFDTMLHKLSNDSKFWLK